MIEINKGTVEEIVVDVVDLLNNLTTLTGTSPTFKVYANGILAAVQTGTPTISSLRALCLIDTTLAGYVPGEYNLYVGFTNVPETPLLGPVKFRVNSVSSGPAVP